MISPLCEKVAVIVGTRNSVAQAAVFMYCVNRSVWNCVCLMTTSCFCCCPMMTGKTSFWQSCRYFWMTNRCEQNCCYCFCCSVRMNCVRNDRCCCCVCCGCYGRFCPMISGYRMNARRCRRSVWMCCSDTTGRCCGCCGFGLLPCCDPLSCCCAVLFHAVWMNCDRCCSSLRADFCG